MSENFCCSATRGDLSSNGIGSYGIKNDSFPISRTPNLKTLVKKLMYVKIEKTKVDLISTLLEYDKELTTMLLEEKM